MYYNDLSESKFPALYSTNSQNNAINIYVLGTTTTGMTSGVASSIPSTAYILHGTRYNTTSVPHEMGHCLGLFHTFHGTVNEGGSDSKQCPELVDGSNASTCGDYIVDTPADPNIWKGCNYAGGGLEDINNQTYNPNPANFMAYSDISCRNMFTPMQIQRMKDCISDTTILQRVVIYSLTGPSLICSGSTATFNIPNILPAGATTSWSVSGATNIVSKSDNSITISPTSSDPFIANVTAEIYQNKNLITTLTTGLKVNMVNFNISGPSSILYLQSGAYSTKLTANNCTSFSTGTCFEWSINGTVIQTSPNITIQSVQAPTTLSLITTSTINSENDSLQILRQPITAPINFFQLSVTAKTSTGKVIGSASMPVTIYGYPSIGNPLKAPQLNSTEVQDNQNISVYPNPTSNILNVEIDRNVIAQPQATQQTEITHEVRLYDVHGKLLLHTKTKDSHIHLNVSHLHNGNYYLHIYDGVSDKPAIHQVVVSH